MGAEARLEKLGIELPAGLPPVGNYLEAVRTGDLLFLARHGPVRVDGTMVTGKVGADLDLDAAREAARLAALNLVATVRRELGSLDAVRRIAHDHGVESQVIGHIAADGKKEVRVPQHRLLGSDGKFRKA